MDYQEFKNRALPAGLLQRVFTANSELEANDRDLGRPVRVYEQLSSDANTRGLTFRQQLAEAAYLVGSASFRSSRAFDNCFENYDGDQVVAYLVGRARANPRLWNAIAADWSGTFPAKWLETAAKATPQAELALA